MFDSQGLALCILYSLVSIFNLLIFSVIHYVSNKTKHRLNSATEHKTSDIKTIQHENQAAQTSPWPVKSLNKVRPTESPVQSASTPKSVIRKEEENVPRISIIRGNTDTKFSENPLFQRDRTFTPSPNSSDDNGSVDDIISDSDEEQNTARERASVFFRKEATSRNLKQLRSFDTLKNLNLLINDYY